MLNSIIEAQVRNSTKYLTFGQPTKHGSIKEIGLHSSSVFIPSVKLGLRLTSRLEEPNKQVVILLELVCKLLRESANILLNILRKQKSGFS